MQFFIEKARDVLDGRLTKHGHGSLTLMDARRRDSLAAPREGGRLLDARAGSMTLSCLD